MIFSFLKTVVSRLEGISQRKITFVGFIICLLAYVFFCFLVGLHGGIDSALYQFPDSGGYRAVAEWIFHGGPMPTAAAKRPFLYPLLLGVPLMISPYAVWLLNICFWFGSIFLLSRTTWILSKSNAATFVVFLCFSFNISLMDLSLRALSELALLFFLALWAWWLVHIDFEAPRVFDIATLILLMVAATLVKPLLQLHLLLLIMTLPLIPAVRRLFRKHAFRLVLAACLALIPLLPQFFIVYSTTGRVAFSTAGGEELRRYTIPELVVRVDTPKGWGDRRQIIEDTRDKISHWDGADILNFIMKHPLLFSKVLIENMFRDNLMDGSVTFGNHPRLFLFSKLQNTVMTLVHIYMAPLILLIILAPGFKAPKWKIMLLAVSASLVFIASGLVFWAGDRIIVIAEAFWLPAYLASLVIIFRHRGLWAVLKGKIPECGA